MVKTTQDKRYRILVMLRRQDRSKMWDFHCMYCKTKVCEISGKDVMVLDDATDVYSKATTGILCPGQFNYKCRDVWYYFEDVK